MTQRHRCFNVLLMSSLLATAPLLMGRLQPATALSEESKFESSDEVNQPQTQPAPAPAFAPCQPTAATGSAGFTQLVSDISRTASLVEQPALSMSTLVSYVGPSLMSYLTPSPFPEIHAQARLAKVPVMMYHDILPEKQVFFDVTVQEFEQHLELIRQKGLTPISMDQLVLHLRTGAPLPAKPILLTFDDGYSGHYKYVYPLLKRYNYPAVFSIYTAKVGKQMGRSSLTWDELREMARDPLVTIASHSVSHAIMPELSAAQLITETQQSKQILEAELGIPIRYFTYPEGKYNAQVAEAVQQAGYLAALTMDDLDERLAGQSESLLAIGRIGQSRLAEMVEVAAAGPPPTAWSFGFDFNAPVRRLDTVINNTPFIFIAGGKPVTIHANSRYQVPQIIANTSAIAAVDGGFFSLEYLDSNVMIGPVYSQSSGRFVPGNASENPRLNGRPLVMISPNAVRFIPFDAARHNALEGVQAEMPDVTDVFVAAAWLVKDGQPRSHASFGNLFDFDAARHRAFWGINQQGQPMIGVSTEPIGSVDLGEALAKAGFRDAVMLDSGASTSLAYQGQSLVGYEPRPVPHVVALVPPGGSASTTCTLASSDTVPPTMR